jgi:hypothetical protein
VSGCPHFFTQLSPKKRTITGHFLLKSRSTFQ